VLSIILLDVWPLQVGFHNRLHLLTAAGAELQGVGELWRTNENSLTPAPMRGLFSFVKDGAEEISLELLGLSLG